MKHPPSWPGLYHVAVRGESLRRSKVPDLVPRLQPILPAADDFERLDDLDAVAPAEAAGGIDSGQIDRDGRRARRHVRLDGAQVLKRLSRSILDHLPRAQRRNLAGRK